MGFLSLFPLPSLEAKSASFHGAESSSKLAGNFSVFCLPLIDLQKAEMADFDNFVFLLLFYFTERIH
jgi:hypothetical protein